MNAVSDVCIRKLIERNAECDESRNLLVCARKKKERKAKMTGSRLKKAQQVDDEKLRSSVDKDESESESAEIALVDERTDRRTSRMHRVRVCDKH